MPHYCRGILCPPRYSAVRDCERQPGQPLLVLARGRSAAGAELAHHPPVHPGADGDLAVAATPADRGADQLQTLGARRLQRLVDGLRRGAGRGVVHAFIPQSHRPGTEAEVDFGDVKVRLTGELVACFVFAMHLSYSGKPCTASSPPAARRRSSKATSTLSACWTRVPTGKVRYDNLRLAVLTAEHNTTIRGVVESPRVSDSTGAYSVPGTARRLDVERGDGDCPHYAAADVPVRAGRRHPTRRPRPLPHVVDRGAGALPCQPRETANPQAGQLTARTAVLFVRSGSKSNGYSPNSPNGGWMLTAPVAPGTTVSTRTENANVRWVSSSTQYLREQS